MSKDLCPKCERTYENLIWMPNLNMTLVVHQTQQYKGHRIVFHENQGCSVTGKVTPDKEKTNG